MKRIVQKQVYISQTALLTLPFCRGSCIEDVGLGHAAVDHDRKNVPTNRVEVNSMFQSRIERVLQSALRRWAAILRLCLVIGVVAATSTTVACLVDARTLLVFMS